MLVIFEGINKK